MLVEYVIRIDESVHAWCAGVRSELLTDVFSVITVLGNWETVVVLVGITGAWCYIYDRRYTLPLILSLVGAEAVTYATKYLINRPRALDALVVETDPSFPSGHAMAAMVFYGFIAAIAYAHVASRTRRVLLVCAGVMLIVLIGVSRLYLGVHYVSDVLAGWIIGGTALVLGLRTLARTAPGGREVEEHA